MTLQQLENLQALRSSIADPKKFFSMGSWEHCVYGHARRLARKQGLDWSIDFFPYGGRARHFEQWTGVPAVVATHVFAGLLVGDEPTNHIGTNREDALAQIDRWIGAYRSQPEETPAPQPAPALEPEPELVLA